MKVLNYSKARGNLASVIDDVVNNYETIIITKNEKSAVVISLSEYNSWKEKAYLMQSVNNAKRLLTAVASMNEGHISNKELLDD